MDRSLLKPSMGNQSSAEVLPLFSKNATDEPRSEEAVFRTHFASVSLHKSDTIRLLNFPPAIIEVFKPAIANAWYLPVQRVGDYYGSTEFKLRGNPWVGYGDEAIHARRLMRTILETLFDNGWVLAFCTDVTKKQFEKDTIIFRHQEPSPSKHQWMSVAFSREDRLRLIDAPDELVQDVLGAIAPKIQRHSPHGTRGVYEFTLKGRPWKPQGGETMVVRMMLLTLIESLEKHGFTVYASVDQKNGAGSGSNYSETDTWHCCRPLSWNSGAPVYHP